jgi:ATP/maltotriose-dependent transcriptional regulator MalT
MYLHTASGKTALALGELEEADRELRLGVELARHNADVLCEGECLAGLAEVALLRGHADQARATAEEVGRCAAGLDNAWLASVGHLLLARSARAEGDFDKALLLGHQALSLQREGGYLLDAVVTLEVIAGIQAWRGAYVDAARLSGSADAARRSLGAQHRPVDVAWHQADRTRLLQVFGEGALRDARREGAALTLDEAVSYASRGRGPRGRDAAGWGSLTPTEMTVVRLVAEGLTNTEIAQRVLVSRATVKVHLSHVFGKLAVANRTELAAQAGRRFTDRSAAPGDP